MEVAKKPVKKVVKKAPSKKDPRVPKTFEDFFENEIDYNAIISKDELWKDPEFPHDDSSINLPKKSFRWQPVSEIFKGKAKIYDSFSCEDVQQGALGDCYLLSAIAALAEFPARVQQLFVQRDTNKAGCYVVKFFLCGQYVNVAVDEFFPINDKKMPAFVGAKANELWVMLIEKGWAKIHGSFGAISAGDSRESFSAITGAPVKYHKHSLYTLEKLWKLIFTADKLRYVMSTGADTTTSGILKGHAYTLINAYEFLLEGKKVQLVQLRNPWGKSEWNGDWHDSDPRWTPELRRKLNHVVKNDGIFFMPFDQFFKIFIHTFISYSRDNYVHSGLVVRESKAAVIFKINKTITGHVSGYSISKRIGKILKSDFEMSSFTLTLYKHDKEGKKDLVQVEEKKSNIIGHASIKVKLEPGIYVLKAEYETQPKIPYIAFAGYTDIAINFIQLKLKDFSEITIAKIRSALEANKPVYEPKETTNNLAGAFRTCLSGHALKHTTKGNGYICENCRKKTPVSDGWWICADCNYQICVKCRPRTHGSIQKKADTEEIKCSKNHPMKFGNYEDPTIYLCDNCGKAYYGSVARWSCLTCQTDLCRRCMIPPNSFKPKKDEVLEIDVCTNGHPLGFVIAESDYGMYECTLCSKVGDTHNGRWTCFECGMNVCHVCKPTDRIKEGMLSVKTKTLVCNKNHMLMFTCKPPPKGIKIGCDKCKAVIGPDYWRWDCDECGYDVCIKCRPEPEGRRDLLCPKMHKLILSNMPKDNATYGRCDSCYIVVNLLKGRYCCLPCQYICCKKCADKLVKA